MMSGLVSQSISLPVLKEAVHPGGLCHFLLMPSIEEGQRKFEARRRRRQCATWWPTVLLRILYYLVQFAFFILGIIVLVGSFFLYNTLSKSKNVEHLDLILPMVQGASLTAKSFCLSCFFGRCRRRGKPCDRCINFCNLLCLWPSSYPQHHLSAIFAGRDGLATRCRKSSRKGCCQG